MLVSYNVMATLRRKWTGDVDLYIIACTGRHGDGNAPFDRLVRILHRNCCTISSAIHTALFLLTGSVSHRNCSDLLANY